MIPILTQDDLFPASRGKHVADVDTSDARKNVNLQVGVL